MLATLWNVFQDAAGMNQFSFVNADLHRRQNLTVQSKFGVNFPTYILDPISTGQGMTNWLELHQDIHNRVNAFLNIQGNDLTDIDFSKPEQMASWIWLHAQEHLQASNILGIF